MLDMVEDMTKNGYRTILIDLPNHGGSDQTEAIVNEDEKGRTNNSVFKTHYRIFESCKSKTAVGLELRS